RRDPADAGHRDQGRRDDEAHRAQHDHPDPQVRGVLHGGGQPAERGDPRPAGRARDGVLQQVARQVPAHGHPARPARRAAGRGRLRHRRQRHPLRVREGPGHGQGAEDRDQGRRRPERRGDQVDGLRRRDARRGGPQGPRARGGPQQRRERRLPGRAPAQGPRRGGGRVLQDGHRGGHQGRARQPDLGGPGGDHLEDRGAADLVPQGLRGDVRARPAAGEQRRRERRRRRRRLLRRGGRRRRRGRRREPL
ncbi:MAG: Chaperone protein DnaK, partial [uncultured Solirubrobacteraceae bacterium]